MRSMNLEQISALMDKFEREFENLDVQSQVSQLLIRVLAGQLTCFA